MDGAPLMRRTGMVSRPVQFNQHTPTSSRYNAAVVRGT